MAIQRYFQRPSTYATASRLWLASPSPQADVDNFGYLIATFNTLAWNTVVCWPVEQLNCSASYTRNGGPEGLLVPGPYNGPIPNHGEVQISDECFFYEDDRLGPLVRPIYTQNTPFLLRGMATALKERVQPHHAGAKPFVFWVRYDGNPNQPGVLSIRRHQW
jgi:hypothetical protein